jgi:hypothetical protein
MTLPNMTAAQFLSAAQQLFSAHPEVELVKNRVGNLSILRNGLSIGWIDLRNGSVNIFEED